MVRLSGGCLFCEAPGGTIAVAAASSGAPDSASAVTMELSVCRTLDALRMGLLNCSAGAARWQECPCCPGFSQHLPVPGECQILGCAPGPVLLDRVPSCGAPSAWSLCWSLPQLILVPCSPLHMEPLPEPLPSYSQGHPSPSVWIHCLSCFGSAPGSSHTCTAGF